MKAEHRHELKTNELAEWLTNLPQWTKDNARTIIYVSVVVVAVAGSYLWYEYQKNVVSVQGQQRLTNIIAQISINKKQILLAQTEERDISYILLQIANNLRGIAQKTKNEPVAAFALIKRAEAMRTELHYRMETAGKEELTDQINRAKASYIEAIEKSSSNPSLMAAARFGLGICEEELGNFTEAKRIYSDIAENASLEATVAATQAKRRLESMADYQQKITFSAVPKPAPAKAIQPQVRIGTTEPPPTQNNAETTETNLPGQ